jgi:Lectin C-type domain
MAKRECKLRGMELLSIETLEEQNAILEQLSKNIKKQHFIQHSIFPLIGGTFVENFWTSGNAEGYSKYEFHWDSTGRIYRQYSQYRNWAAGQPDGELSPENCIILSHVDGFKWHDVGCQSDYLRYICEKKGL